MPLWAQRQNKIRLSIFAILKVFSFDPTARDTQLLSYRRWPPPLPLHSSHCVQFSGSSRRLLFVGCTRRSCSSRGRSPDSWGRGLRPARGLPRTQQSRGIESREEDPAHSSKFLQEKKAFFHGLFSWLCWSQEKSIFFCLAKTFNW